MANKPENPKCEANDCTKTAVHGFRQLQDTTSMKSRASEFEVVSSMNFCDDHLNIGRQFYSRKKNVKYADLSKA